MEEKKSILEKIKFLEEMISERNSQFNQMLESIKRVEGYSNGAKELSEKIGNYIKKQQAELDNLKSQQKIAPDVSAFVGNILEGIRTFVRATCGDVERVYFSNQGELLFVKDDIEKLNKKKLNHLNEVQAIEAKEKQQEVNAEENKNVPAEEVDDVQQKSKKKKRVRPDKDPTTRVGRAAMDIAERRKTARKKKNLS